MSEDTGLLLPMETALIVVIRVHTARGNANLTVVIRLNNGKFFTSTLWQWALDLIFWFHLIFWSFRYHVPRSWLMPTKNLIVVFEEVGGNPSRISLVKRSVTSICTEASQYLPVIKNVHMHQNYAELNEQNVLKINLHCAAGQFISAIKFASFGTPTGACGSHEQGTCHSPKSDSVLQKVCESTPSYN